MKRFEYLFIIFTVFIVISLLFSIIFFVSPNGLSLLLHIFILLSLLCVSISSRIIIKHMYQKYPNRLFLMVNISCALFAIFGLILILYNLPFGFNLPIDIINGQYIDGTSQVISGIMSIVISALSLFIFYTIHRAIYD